MSLSEMVIAPNPSGDEALVEGFWKFLKSGDTLFTIEKYNIDGVASLSITRGTFCQDFS